MEIVSFALAACCNYARISKQKRKIVGGERNQNTWSTTEATPSEHQNRHGIVVPGW